MLDFSSLLTGLAEEVKRKPNTKPQPLQKPSEVALGDLIGGAEEAIKVTDDVATPVNNVQPLAQAEATQAGIADQPANADNIYAGMAVPSENANTGQPRTLNDEIAEAEANVKSATNAPIKKQSLWKDFGAKLIQGADAFFNGNRTPIVGWGKLKHDQAIQSANAKLNPLLAMRETENKNRKAQEESALNGLEYRIKMSKGAQDAFNNDPDVLLIKESKRVTPDQAQRLNGKYGTNYTPAFWGSFVEKEVGGQSYIRPSDRPNYAANTSIAKDVTEAPVQVPLSGGGMGAVPSKTAVTLDGAERVAGITANRQIATTNANIADGVQQRNTKAINDYNNSVVQFGNTVAQKMAELGDTAGAGEISKLTEQANAINAKYTNASDEEEADKYKAEMEKVNAKLTAIYDKQSKNTAVQQALQGMKPPVKPKLEKPVQVDMNSSGKPFAQPQNVPKVATTSDVKEYAKLAKVSLATAKKYFTDAGFSVQ